MTLEDSHPRKEKPKYFGEVTEMDGCSHLWFGDKKACLHLAVDKATNTIVGGFFDWQETLNGYYYVFKQILEKYGIPAKFLTDNRTVLNYLSLNKDKRTDDKDVLTQFGYACKQLEVSLDTTSVSQAKGLIERDNQTFQDRLVSELRLNGIATIDDANKYLSDIFIPKFNSKFALDYTKFQSIYEVSPSAEKINYILAILSKRKIDNSSNIKYKNTYYQPYKSGQLVCFKAKTDFLVIKAFDNNLFVTIDDKISEKVEESQVYTPKINSSWKLASFIRHVDKSVDEHIYLK